MALAQGTSFFDERKQKNPFVGMASALAGLTMAPSRAGPFIDTPNLGPIKVPLTNLSQVSAGYGDPGAAIGSAASPQASPGVVPVPGPGTSSADYAALLDRMMEGLRTEASAATKARQAAMGANLQRAVIQFGEVPAGVDSSAISGDTRSLAEKNTSSKLSTVARLNEAHSDAIEGIRNALAARGILSSGETGYQLGREDTAYGRSQSDARNQLLDYVAGLQSAFDEAERQQQWALAQAAMGAAASIPVYPDYGYPPPPAPPDAGTPPAPTPTAGAPPPAHTPFFGTVEWQKAQKRAGLRPTGLSVL